MRVPVSPADMKIRRRKFLQTVVAGSTVATLWGEAFAALDHKVFSVPGYGPLRPDPETLLDLPADFKYRIVSRVGDPMSDGLRVPGRPDSMAAFKGPDERVILMCNYELNVSDRQHAFVGIKTSVGPDTVEKLYDPAVGKGGVATLIIEEQSLRREQQFLSLGGTLRNCSGGATPWGSWLSCEESVVRAGEYGAGRDHGYVFEIPSAARELQPARPIKAMGRFNHEAAAVDPASGIVYLSEDRGDGLLYRFIPNTPGALAAGGRLEALSIVGLEGGETGNRDRRQVPLHEPRPVRWLPMDGIDAPNDDLRRRGQALGATRFVRGEGLAVQKNAQGRTMIWLMATSGGPQGLGQVWRYYPSPEEGQRTEAQRPGRLELFLEPADAALQNHGDNLAIAPNGDLLICEDSSTDQRVLGVTPAGGIYLIARNPRGNSEFAGAVFSPSGRTLFVNIQHSGLTFAIQGDWTARRVT